MARIPTPESITGPESLRPSSPAPVADMSGLTRGVENLAGSFNEIIRDQTEKQATTDFARAEAYSTKEYLRLGNEMQQDGDYTTIADRADKASQDITTNAAAMIRNPRAREQWTLAHEEQRVRQVDSIGDIGRAKANEAERVSFLGALDDNAQLITEPSVPEDIRNKARQDLLGTIEVARQNGLLSPAEADNAKRTYLDKAEEQLALNRADALIRSDPNYVLENTGIKPTGNPLDDARAAVRVPIVAAPGVNIADVDQGVLTRWEQTQSTFGKQIPVISGARTREHNDAVGGAKGSQHLDAKAIDLDVSGLSQEERIKLIQTASAQGFTGIGVYNNSLHLDTGPRRAWGPSYHADSVPAWAKDAINQHTSGRVVETPLQTDGVAPEFAALSYQQRAAIFDQAKIETDRQGMSLKAGLETTATNAPAAIARGGKYDGNLPDANAFVQAYGAQEGLDRYKAFDASVKVAQDSFSMRTMTADQIATLVEQSVPTSSGNDAALQEESFQQVSAAAAATLKARNEDPSNYVQEVYPAVADAWQAAQDNDPVKYQQAIAITALAQEQLGIQNPVLLPKAMASNAAAMFNNAALPDDQRLGALTQLVMGTKDPKQQATIYQQMLGAGVPEMTRGAMEAMARGDSGAAQRLFSAALVKPEELNKRLPGDVKPAQIDDEIQAQLFDTGQIGDIAYDLTYGSAANQNAAITDTALMSNSVKLRMLDGSAGGNLQRAIDLTVKDMFGDVQVVSGKSWGGKSGMKLLLPADADTARYQTGFDSLLGEVGDALSRDLSRDMADAPAEGGQAAIAQAAASGYVEQALSEGYFTNADREGSIFKFIDPNSGSAVVGPDGNPLTFSAEEVLSAGATASQVQSSRPSTPRYINGPILNEPRPQAAGAN